MKDYFVFLEGKGMSKNTIRSYTTSVRLFYKMYPAINQETLNDYRKFLVENCCSTTANLRIAGINNYLRYKKLPLNPIRGLRVNSPSFAEKIVTKNEYEMLKSRIKASNNLTIYLLFRFMASTGMRVSEALTIEYEDVVAGYKDVVSKSSRVRRIFIPSAVREEALRLLPKEMSGHIFLNSHGKVITPSGVRYWFRRYAEQNNIAKGHAHPHALRHRFALNFLEKSSDIALLADLLGHESIETTRIYLKRTSDEQRAFVNQIVDW